MKVIVFMDRKKIISELIKENSPLSLSQLRGMFPGASDDYIISILKEVRKESLGFYGENTGKKTKRF